MKAKYSRKLTLDEHRKMWHWIADTIAAENRIVTKKDYFIAQSHLDYKDLISGCYCCDYVFKRHLEEHLEAITEPYTIIGDFCMYCPLIWSKRRLPTPCLNKESPYAKFHEAVEQGNIEDCIKYSRAIALLSEKREENE